eukprot:tig00021720_g23175.t1
MDMKAGGRPRSATATPTGPLGMRLGRPGTAGSTPARSGSGPARGRSPSPVRGGGANGARVLSAHKQHSQSLHSLPANESDMSLTDERRHRAERPVAAGAGAAASTPARPAAAAAAAGAGERGAGACERCGGREREFGSLRETIAALRSQLASLEAQRGAAEAERPESHKLLSLAAGLVALKAEVDGIQRALAAEQQAGNALRASLALAEKQLLAERATIVEMRTTADANQLALSEERRLRIEALVAAERLKAEMEALRQGGTVPSDVAQQAAAAAGELAALRATGAALEARAAAAAASEASPQERLREQVAAAAREAGAAGERARAEAARAAEAQQRAAALEGELSAARAALAAAQQQPPPSPPPAPEAAPAGPPPELLERASRPRKPAPRTRPTAAQISELEAELREARADAARSVRAPAPACTRTMEPNPRQGAERDGLREELIRARAEAVPPASADEAMVAALKAEVEAQRGAADALKAAAASAQEAQKLAERELAGARDAAAEQRAAAAEVKLAAAQEAARAAEARAAALEAQAAEAAPREAATTAELERALAEERAAAAAARGEAEAARSEAARLREEAERLAAAASSSGARRRGPAPARSPTPPPGADAGRGPARPRCLREGPPRPPRPPAPRRERGGAGAQGALEERARTLEGRLAAAEQARTELAATSLKFAAAEGRIEEQRSRVAQLEAQIARGKPAAPTASSPTTPRSNTRSVPGRSNSTLTAGALSASGVQLLSDAERKKLVAEHAKYLGVDPEREPQLMWVAERALGTGLPIGWEEHVHENNLFFWNGWTEESTWEHPVDVFFQRTLADLRAGGALLGALVTTLTPQLAKHISADPKYGLQVPETAGALIVDTLPNSGAERGGLKRGDVVVEANGTPVENAAGFATAAEGFGKGERCKLRVRRGTDGKSYSVVL